MNKDRRKQIDDVYEKIQDLVGTVEDIQYEEQNAFDSMPEGLQESERGQAASEAADHLVDAMDCLNSALDALDAARSES
jgi:hypothetical protein